MSQSAISTAPCEPLGLRWRERLLLVAAAACLAASGSGCGAVSQGQNVEGVRYFQQGRYQDALERFQRALYNNPNNADAYYNLAATYHRTGKMQGTKTDLDQAESFYNQCLDRNPNHADAYRGLAVLLVEEKRTDEAFRLLQGWADRAPTLATPKIELARLHDEFGNREVAMRSLQDALAIDPYDARALTALGKLHEQAGNYVQALADYQRSLWYNRFQPEVAARVAALQTAISPQPLADPTRTVTSPAPPQVR